MGGKKIVLRFYYPLLAFLDGELSNLKLCDIEMYASHVKLFLERSKTDQFREGAWVVVSL